MPNAISGKRDRARTVTVRPEDTVRSVVGSFALEGLEVSAQDQALALEVASGRLSADDAVARIISEMKVDRFGTA